MKTILGKLHLKWCLNCNIPILGNKCGICNSETSPVKITPPADPRLAFNEDIKMIDNILKNQFNINLENGESGIFKNKIVLINKIPGIDYMKEIILDGVLFGIVKYIEKENKWVIMPSVEGARRIVNKGATEKLIVINKEVVPFVLTKHASILRPGVIDISNNINEGDEVIIVVENKENISNNNNNNNYNNNNNKNNKYKDINVLGVGKSKMSSQQIKNCEKGMVAKVRKSELLKEQTILKETGDFKQSTELLIKGNKESMERFIQNSVGFMRNTIKDRTNKPPVVAYSGGKDSLAVLLLAIEAFENENIKFDVIFSDTQLELPETLQNVEIIKEKYNVNIIIAKATEFWNKLEELGPPSRDNRWCSEVCKMAPLQTLINKKYENGCLTFVGLRKYESMNRSKKPRIWNSPHIKKQMLCAPILNWTALHVWIYLLSKKAPYNKLYEKCFDRVGCYMCPAMELGEFELVRKIYPEYIDNWENILKDYAKKHNLSEEWVNGNWRWKYKNNENNENKKDSGIFE